MKWTFVAVETEAEKYITRTEFARASESAYNAARKNDWLESVCKHMKQRFSWTIDLVSQEAIKYHTRQEFNKAANGAYQVAIKNEWIDEVCAHMPTPVRWTKKLVKVEALKYETRNEFRENSSGAHDFARRKGYLDDVCSHMNRLVRRKWTLEDCKDEALKYKTRTEFSRCASGAYSAAKDHNWLDSICSHMDLLWEKKWTLETVMMEAYKYETRNDFRNKGRGAYGAAHSNGWLDKACVHMVNGRLKWTIEKLRLEAKKYNSRTEFSNGSGGAYKAACDKGWLDEICKHMQINDNGFYHCVYVILNKRLNQAYVGITSQKFSLRMIQHKMDSNPCNSKFISQLPDTDFIALTKYIYTAKQVKEYAEQQYVDEYFNKGFELLNDQKTIGSVGYSRRMWSIEKCHEEALKFTTRWEFQQESMNAYTAAKNHDWLNEICMHMIEVVKSNDYWTFDNCKKEALKHKTRNELFVSSSYVHKLIYKRGWADEAFAHMEKEKLSPWEKTNANHKVWLMADEIYKLWKQHGQCSGFVLSKYLGLVGHALNSVVKNFKSDWVPLQDQEWLNWRDNMKD